MRLIDIAILAACLGSILWLLSQEHTVKLSKSFTIPTSVVQPSFPPTFVLSDRHPAVILAQDDSLFLGALDLQGSLASRMGAFTFTRSSAPGSVPELGDFSVMRIPTLDNGMVSHHHDHSDSANVGGGGGGKPLPYSHGFSKIIATEYVPESNLLLVLTSDFTFHAYNFSSYKKLHEYSLLSSSLKETTRQQKITPPPPLDLLWTTHLISPAGISTYGFYASVVGLPRVAIVERDRDMGICIVGVETRNAEDVEDRFYFAVGLRDGSVRWGHAEEEEEEQVVVDDNNGIKTQHHHHHSAHLGFGLRAKTIGAVPFIETREGSESDEGGAFSVEETFHWRALEGDIFDRALPHRFRHYFDFGLIPAHFATWDVKKPPKSSQNADDATTVYDAVDERLVTPMPMPGSTGDKFSLDEEEDEFVGPDTALFADSSFSSSSSSSDDIDINLPPNVLVVHHETGIEIVHLYTGLVLSHIGPLNRDTLYDDFGNDRVIESATVRYDDPDDRLGQKTCIPSFHKGIPAHTEPLYLPEEVEFPLCSIKSLLRSLVPTSVLDLAGGVMLGGEPGHRMHVATPTSVDRKSKETEFKGKDIVFFASSGVVTSLRLLPVNPYVIMRWQVETPSSFVSRYDNFFEVRGLAARVESARRRFLVVTGARYMTLMDRFGNIMETVDMGGSPVAPMQMVDFTGDGLRDILIWTEDELIGFQTTFSVGRNNTFTVLVLGLAIVLVLMYLSTAVKKDLKPRREKHD